MSKVHDLDKLLPEEEVVVIDGKKYGIPTSETGLFVDVGPLLRRLKNDKGLREDPSFLRDFVVAGTDIPEDVGKRLKLKQLMFIVGIIYPKARELAENPPEAQEAIEASAPIASSEDSQTS